MIRECISARDGPETRSYSHFNLLDGCDDAIQRNKSNFHRLALLADISWLTGSHYNRDVGTIEQESITIERERETEMFVE